MREKKTELRHFPKTKKYLDKSCHKSGIDAPKHYLPGISSGFWSLYLMPKEIAPDDWWIVFSAFSIL